ncbi:MAG: ORF6N domain-containing protein [Sulfuricurvum sp.]|nr:ORF6N domain-containing protein [Sulfuricurvum sp.]
MNNLALIDNQTIQNKIYTIRDMQVMIDRELADLYGVETKRLNEQVKRNIERFPKEFMFQMTIEELENWKSQFATSNKEIMGLRKLPFVFTEQGVSMLSSVLKSDTAIQTSIQIINTFVNMRKFISLNAGIFQRFERVEQRLLLHDEKFNKIFDAIEEKGVPQKQHIFYEGQIFDAYLFVSDIIKSAKTSIKLIDNYIDESILVLFAKRDTKVNMKIYTKTISKQLQLDLQKHNAQYPKIEIEKFDLSHDRFLIIDDMDVYHFGASLKDLGKKWFAVSRLDINSFELVGKLK